jgi:SAM-dependent methyltransferase
LEIGAGTGNISEYFIALKDIVLSDYDVDLVEHLKDKFQKHPNVKAEVFDISKHFSKILKKFSTIYAINVLEHIEKDNVALSNINRLLKENGRIVLLVPAKKFAYTKLDKSLGHFRRYEKNELREKLERAGFAIEYLEYFNIVGLLSWLVRTKLTRQHNELKSFHVKLFDLIVPLLRRIEPPKGMPAGISLIAVGKKYKT